MAEYPDRYRPCTGQEISRYLQAKAMGAKPGKKGYLTKADVDAFLASRGVA